MKRILVLGGGGFIGGHLAKHFKDHGESVTIVDLKKHSHFKEAEICDRFIVEDLRDPRVVKKIFFREYDVVYQLAADVGGAQFISGALYDSLIITNSAVININVARQIPRGRIGELFFSSSSCAYPEPEGVYGLEKLFSESVYETFRRDYTTHIYIGRFQNVFGTHDNISGPRERFMTAICRKIVQAKNGDSVLVWGDGTQKRSFIYVKDCISEIMNLMRSEIFTPYNIGNTKLISINDIARMIIDISGKKLNIENILGPTGPMTKNYPALTKEISFQGLKETYEWVKTTLNEN